MSKVVGGRLVLFCPSLREIKIWEIVQRYWRWKISRSYRLHWISKKKSKL